jgi:hypothetical protein
MTHLEDRSKILDVDSHDADPSFKMVDGLDMFHVIDKHSISDN